MAPHLAAMGITRVANVTGLDHIGIPVVMVCRPNSRALAVAQGKGTTVVAAKASGVMESVETFHAERILRPLLYGSLNDLGGHHRLIPVEHLNRPIDNAFTPDLPLLWIEGFDLIRQDNVWVPFELVHANFTTPRPSGSGCFAQTSNGLASGNHILESINHGLNEVVERDAATLWSLAGPEQQRNTRIDLDTVADPECRTVLDRLESAGMAVAVWDMSSDIDIPAYMCIFCERSAIRDGSIENYRGYGCHPTHRIALLRALTEAIQMRLTIIAGSRDDLDPSHYRGRAAKGHPKQSAEWLDDSPPFRPFAHSVECDSDTFDDDIEWQLGQLIQAGIQSAVVVDLTKPEFDVPVTRVVVPGLEMAFMEWSYYATGPRAQRVENRTVSA